MNEAMRADKAFLESLPAEEFDALPERWRTVLACRYGLNGEEPLTFKATAERVGVSAARVEQIQRAAWRRIDRSWRRRWRFADAQRRNWPENEEGGRDGAAYCPHPYRRS